VIPVVVDKVIKNKEAEIKLEEYHKNLEILVTERTKKLQDEIKQRIEAEEKLNKYLLTWKKLIKDFVFAMEKAIEVRDPYTSGHQFRVSELVRAIAIELGYDEDRLNGIYFASLIHDIGKVYIPSEILTKPTKLSTIEYKLIQSHPEIGFEILKQIDFPWPLAEIILQHHERINGSGYPRGLQKNGILNESKIIAVADVVEAISSHRPYRPARGIEMALDEIKKNRGVLYDDEIVEICLKIFLQKKFKFSE
ncbi:MAG TPA: HD domain-containing protein, partial [Firmicutes bacterium]|nr:HD domain-containing protein [Bacillota bacterium]